MDYTVKPSARCRDPGAGDPPNGEETAWGVEESIVDLAVALLAPIAGFFVALWGLLLWVGDGVILDAEGDVDPILGERDQVAIYDSYAPFIPMPEHLRTKDEMVEWMTKELPKLTAEQPNLRP